MKLLFVSESETIMESDLNLHLCLDPTGSRHLVPSSSRSLPTSCQEMGLSRRLVPPDAAQQHIQLETLLNAANPPTSRQEAAIVGLFRFELKAGPASGPRGSVSYTLSDPSVCKVTRHWHRSQELGLGGRVNWSYWASHCRNTKYYHVFVSSF